MPETEDLDVSSGRKQDPEQLDQTLGEVLAERDRLRQELDSRANADIVSWLRVVDDESRMLRDMQQTLSWRITKPLRLARKVQKKAAEVGVVEVSQLAVADLRRRFRGQRR
jgi:hypothetical protein